MFSMNKQISRHVLTKGALRGGVDATALNCVKECVFFR
jgi:hypothetical protein